MDLNIPTALSEREAELLSHLSFYYPRVVEIGSLLGYSTLTLAKNANSVISIDPHKDYPHEGASSWRPFMRNINKYGKGNILPIKKLLQDTNVPDADMVFIDLDGTYGTTKMAIEKASHIPILVIHDFDRQNCSGVRKAVEKSNRNIKVVDSCALLWT